MSIFEHFRKEEHAFIEQALEWKAAVEHTYDQKLTDFLDPREQDILASVVGKDEIVYLSFWGGSENCERKRALLYPFYENIHEEDFDMTLYDIHYPSKFVKISHRDVLGSLMGLGLERRKFGDILEYEGNYQFVTAKEIAPFVEMNLQQIGKGPVTLSERSFHSILPVEEEWVYETTTVTSFRIDALIAKMYNISRSKANAYIEKKLVKVNWKTTEQASSLLQQGDYVSVRGLGRTTIREVEGQTKKGRWRIVYGTKGSR